MDTIIASLSKHSVEDLQIINEFLLRFRATEYQELYRIFRLPLDLHQDDESGQTLWDRYFATQRFHLIEMKLMRKQASVARNAFKTIPIKEKLSTDDSEDETDEIEEPFASEKEEGEEDDDKNI